MRRSWIHLLDALLPGAGRIAEGRWRSGINVTGAFLGLQGLLAVSVAWADLDPRRALVTAGLVWLTFQGLLFLDDRPANPQTPSLPRGLLALILAGAFWAILLGILSVRTIVVPVRNHALWPALLPGEWVLVHRTDATDLTHLQGRLVAVQTESGVLLGRLVAMGPGTLRWNGPGVSWNGDEIPLTDLGDVVVEAPFDHPDEGRGLRAWMESLGEQRYPVFFSRMITVSSREIALPEGTLGVIADNRSTLDARDSRVLGPIPRDRVLGTVGPVIWSPGPGWNARWQRIGLRWP